MEKHEKKMFFQSMFTAMQMYFLDIHYHDYEYHACNNFSQLSFTDPHSGFIREAIHHIQGCLGVFI